MDTQNTNNQNKPPKSNNSANMAGAFIVTFGLVLLLKNLQLGLSFPSWLFGWEMILIIVGVVIGVNSGFQKKSAYILISIGAVFFMKNLFGLSFGKFVLPVLLIVLGLYLVNRNRKLPPVPPQTPPTPKDEYDWDKRVDDTFVGHQYQPDNAEQHAENRSDTDPEGYSGSTKFKKYTTQYDNYLKVDSFFSDTKKMMLSKNFLGGTITSVFGSTSINFLAADIKQPVVLDTFQLFGSTKIIIPPHWQISSNVASIFGDLDDRRPMFEITTDSNKKIYITGTSIFGGLTIKNS